MVLFFFCKVYPDWLSQVISVAFWEVFPESIKYLDDDFKEGLVDLVFQWISATGSIFPFPEEYFVQATGCVFQ